MLGQKEHKNADQDENRFKKAPGSAGKSIKRSSSIDNSNSAVSGSLNNSNSAFCISLQNSTDLSDDQSDNDDFPGKASKDPTNAHDSMRNAKHSARVRSRGKSTDRFHPNDFAHENTDHKNSHKATYKNNQSNNIKKLNRNDPTNKPTDRKKTNHLTKWNSIDSMGKGANSRFIKIWIETLVGTAYEVFISRDEPIFNLKLKLEIEENIPVLYQTLYYGEDELIDSFTIEEYEIENGATLKLQIQDKKSGKHRKSVVGPQPTFAIDERTYNLLFDETVDGQKRLGHNSASLTDSKSIDEFRMLNASSNLGCISVIGEHKTADELDSRTDPYEKREKMTKQLMKWSKFNKQTAVKLPNLNGNLNGNLNEKERVATDLGSSNSLNGLSNLSIPNSLSSPNNLTVLGSKQKEQPNDGKRLSNQFEKKNFSIKSKFFPRFRSNSSFNLVIDYGGDKSEKKADENNESKEERANDKLIDSNKIENRPSSVPHVPEKKSTVMQKFGIRKLFGQRNSADISHKKVSDPQKKNKKAKNDRCDKNLEKTNTDGDRLREASDRLKPLPRKLPPVEVAGKKEKCRIQKCLKCKKRACVCELAPEVYESQPQDASFIDYLESNLDKAKSKKKILPKI